MAQVTVTINDRKYNVACDDGQEAHLARLGGYVDKRVGELVAAVGQIGDAKLLVMVSLLLADELSDTYAAMDKMKNGHRDNRGDHRGDMRGAEAEERVARILEKCADRIEGIAQRIEQA